MESTHTDWAPSATDAAARENRIRLALLRGVIEHLKPNRVMIPLFALLTCAMFAQWVPWRMYGAWYGIVLASLLPSLLLKVPNGDLAPAQVTFWIRAASAGNVVFVLGWSSLGWFLWVPGNDFNHILVQLVLAATLASHAGLVGPSRDIGRPAFLAFGIVMTLTPLQAHGTPYVFLALVSPFYVAHVAFMARQQHVRAHAALALERRRTRCSPNWCAPSRNPTWAANAPKPQAWPNRNSSPI